MSIDGLPLGDNKLHHDMQNDPDPKSGHVNGLRCVLDPVADGDPAGVMAQNTNLLIRMLKTSGTIGGHRVEHHDLDEDLLRQAVNDVSARWKRP
ncbi:hypothetical protein GNI_011470 [Gregarina niphandrodes]|uniref:Uncharacterized protein n=1 Tax=Gregarina niphandrodes TaxID=110365 RepID=A0A023BCT0_GRENI|nr:hypothetical protein GNI_011470 [Gregarina niphandrodes]EZG85839.1 hypothetical protein GNI_011470 [Gregarina niphandrodes]|eukprot:XP_011128816.1 hypothetical protein GNI_011470 [Gregarina niphandrodes]